MHLVFHVNSQMKMVIRLSDALSKTVFGYCWWGNYAAVPLKCSFKIKCFPLVQSSDETDVKPLQTHENSFLLGHLLELLSDVVFMGVKLKVEA